MTTAYCRSLAIALLVPVAGCLDHPSYPSPNYPSANYPSTTGGGQQSRTVAADEESAAPSPSSDWSRPTTTASTPPPAPTGSGYPIAPPPVERAERPVEQPQQQPAERPGLATVWGETRASLVREVPFSRDDAPFAVATVYYNDRAGAAATAAPDARAAEPDFAVPMRGGLLVQVVDEAGTPYEAFSVGGRVYVVGEAGRRYTLVVRNLTARRYEIVASVDGLDVIDGKRASTEKRGYLVDEYATLTIDGFRRSHEEVAAFRFGSVGESYAARTGDDRHVGVIGLAMFAERGAPAWSDDEVRLRRTAQPFADTRFAQPPQ